MPSSPRSGNAGEVCNGDNFFGCSGDPACTSVENSYDGGMISFI